MSCKVQLTPGVAVEGLARVSRREEGSDAGERVLRRPLGRDELALARAVQVRRGRATSRPGQLGKTTAYVNAVGNVLAASAMEHAAQGRPAVADRRLALRDRRRRHDQRVRRIGRLHPRQQGPDQGGQERGRARRGARARGRAHRSRPRARLDQEVAHGGRLQGDARLARSQLDEAAARHADQGVRGRDGRHDRRHGREGLLARHRVRGRSVGLKIMADAGYDPRRSSRCSRPSRRSRAAATAGSRRRTRARRTASRSSRPRRRSTRP